MHCNTNPTQLSESIGLPLLRAIVAGSGFASYLCLDVLLGDIFPSSHQYLHTPVHKQIYLGSISDAVPPGVCSSWSCFELVGISFGI